MLCAFCNIETKEKHEKDNVIVIAHTFCLADRMQELNTINWHDCLRYEDQIRDFGETRSI